MTITYTEARDLLKKVKKEAQHKIVDILINSGKPLTLTEISETIGASMSATSAWASTDNWTINKYAGDRGYRFYRNKRIIEILYVNPFDPTDTVVVKRTRTYCWVERF